MCQKIQFSSKKDARHYIKCVKSRPFNKKAIGKMTCYDCKECDFWHITQAKKLKFHKLK